MPIHAFRIVRWLYATVLLAFLVACTGPPIFGPQIPGPRGLALALEGFQDQARLHNWLFLFEGYYLPEHDKEVHNEFNGDLGRWFQADPVVKALTGGEIGDNRVLCMLALREKRVSPRFEPHYVVYYRVQEGPCDPALNPKPKIFAQGHMDWGYEVKSRRWVHLRPLR